jgi:hypothetical protein
MLVAHGRLGVLYLNGREVAALDLSDNVVTGDVSLATGLYVDREQAGAATAYTDFTVWYIP